MYKQYQSINNIIHESNRGVSGEIKGQSRVIQTGRPVFAGEGVGSH
jgi:hypothetical protein